ncbi:MAG TPA: helix-turn-helix domain-containing protein [Prolixibacteraceae bacterium]|nr:helix-turn-helix domain-containing protein [Prolixibacteraceae bacterium]
MFLFFVFAVRAGSLWVANLPVDVSGYAGISGRAAQWSCFSWQSAPANPMQLREYSLELIEAGRLNSDTLLENIGFYNLGVSEYYRSGLSVSGHDLGYALYEKEKKELQDEKQQNEVQRSKIRLKYSMAITLLLFLFIALSIVVFLKRNHMLHDLLRKNMEAMEAEKRLRKALNDAFVSYLPLMVHVEKYKHSTLTATSRNVLEEHFNRLMNEQQLWKEGDITLAKIANLLHTNTKYVSQIINQTYGQSFPNYINELRIKAARCMLVSKEYSNYTIEAIGSEVGFNSNSSFVTAFKKFSGLTPSYFRTFQRSAKG